MSENRVPYVNRIYAVVVYCGICGDRMGKVNQGGDRVDIICMDCAETEDKKLVVVNR